jgi:hypothetical protein
MRPASCPDLLEELTPDDFVGAVMRTHDRIRSRLNALKRGASGSPAAEPADDAQIIDAYCLHHGVEARRLSGHQHAGSRWLAV